MRIKCEKLGLDEARAVAVGPSDQLLALDEALQQLEEKDPRLSRIVELRFFGDLSEEETGEVLGPDRETRLEHGKGLVVSTGQMTPDCWERIRTGRWRVFGSNKLLKYSLDMG